MRTARSAIGICVALLLAGMLPLPSAAQDTPGVTGGCQGASNQHAGSVSACDGDRNLAPDRITFELGLALFDEDTRTKIGQGSVEVDEERRRSPRTTDERYNAEVLAQLALPSSPTFYYAFQARDDGADGDIDHTRSRGGLYTRGIEDRSATHFLGLWDLNDDGRLESYGAQGCTHDTGCSAPDVRSVPKPPSLPDPTFYIDPIGWVP